MEAFFSEYGLTIGGILAAIAASVGGYGGYQWLRKPTLASNEEAIKRTLIASKELGVSVSPQMSVKALLDEHQKRRLKWDER